MSGPVIRTLLIFGVLFLIVYRLLNRHHKQTLREIVQISAGVFLAATALALAWLLYQYIAHS